MQAEFYDVKAKAKVTEEVTKKVIYKKIAKDGSEQLRYAFKGKSSSTGTNLTKFVSRDAFEKAPAPVETVG